MSGIAIAIAGFAAMLVLIGILGGAAALGFIGIFLGPTILAVLYALMREWSPGDIVGSLPRAPLPEEAPPAPSQPQA